MADKIRVYTSTPTFPNPQLLQLALEKGIEGDLEEALYDTSPGRNQRNLLEVPHNTTTLDERFEYWTTAGTAGRSATASSRVSRRRERPGRARLLRNSSRRLLP